MKPLARREALIVEELDGETLVYDLKSHKAHCLNGTSAAVWRLCDGKRSTTDIAKALGSATPRPVRVEVVELALEQLASTDLLIPSQDTRGPSRRRALRRLAAAAALPAIVSIVAPTAAQAATCTPNRPGCAPNDAACTRSSDCCSCCCKDVGGGNAQCKPGGGNCLPP